VTEPAVSSRLTFRVLGRDGEARVGQIMTPRGTISTPVFMPVGTAGAVKGLTTDQLRALGPEIILCNTYHLMLRPGVEVIEQLGDLHDFISWDRAILTDSGGFQVFSLAEIRKVREEGVEFQSHIDGSRHFLSPEGSIGIQQRLGVEIAMAFDECPRAGLEHDEVERSMELTHRWAERSLRARTGRSALFGIVQGGTFEDLRRRSAEVIGGLDFDGTAIGGVSVGEPKGAMLDTMRFTAPLLPAGKPRYLMGVGTPEDLVEGVAAGIDMFDCVLPTRNARNGTLFTSRGRVSIKNAQYRTDEGPLDPDCGCPACQSVSRAYVRHLFVAGEMSAAVYNTIHNLFFYLDLMRRIRQSIASRTFEELRRETVARAAEGDPEATGD
jgi:queuine tRNA-ribosyltransferase